MVFGLPLFCASHTGRFLFGYGLANTHLAWRRWIGRRSRVWICEKEFGDISQDSFDRSWCRKVDINFKCFVIRTVLAHFRTIVWGAHSPINPSVPLQFPADSTPSSGSEVARPATRWVMWSAWDCPAHLSLDLWDYQETTTDSFECSRTHGGVKGKVRGNYLCLIIQAFLDFMQPPDTN